MLMIPFYLLRLKHSITINSIYNMGHTSSRKTTNRSAAGAVDDEPLINIFSPAHCFAATVFSFFRSARVPILSQPALPGQPSGSSVSVKTWILGRGHDVPPIEAVA